MKANFRVQSDEIGVRQKKHWLIRRCFRMVNSAIELEFHLQAIALEESIIADRLESKFTKLFPHEKSAGMIRTAPQSAEDLMTRNISNDLRELCNEVKNWGPRRNMALHRMAKLWGTEEEQNEMAEVDLALIAIEGYELAKVACAVSKKVNKQRLARVVQGF